MSKRVIKLSDWQGNELLNDFVDYVNTGMANAKAIASVDTGKMVASVKADKVADGYAVTATALGRNGYHYPTRYSLKGYGDKTPPLDFLWLGFMDLNDNHSIGRGSSWIAVKDYGRPGSGFSNIRGVKIPQRLIK